MHLFVFAVILAMVATAVTLFLGLAAMSRGGEKNENLSERYMWERVGLQALALLLLGIALLVR